MYEEWQKKLVYDQAHGSKQCGDKRYLGNQKHITATSSNKNTTGGTTSSSAGKMTGNGKGRDSGGRWITMKGTTYGGAGEPMQINRAKKMKEGRCFICDKHGHISRDCPMKAKWQEVCAVEMAEVPLSKDTKIEEVKD